ncbi:hypothetical protein ACYOEI_05915 [Singulisphaera rosea]
MAQEMVSNTLFVFPLDFLPYRVNIVTENAGRNRRKKTMGWIEPICPSPTPKAIAMKTYTDSREAAQAVVSTIRQAGIEIAPEFLQEYERQIERAIVRAWAEEQVRQQIDRGALRQLRKISRRLSSLYSGSF